MVTKSEEPIVDRAPSAYSTMVGVLLVGTGGALIDAEQAIAAVDARLIATVAIEDAADRLTRQTPPDIVLVEFTADDGAIAEFVIAEAAILAREHGTRVILSFPTALIDPIVAASAPSQPTLLCDPEPMDRVSALGLAVADMETRLRDGGVASIEADRLQQLTEEVGRIARALAALSGAAAGPRLALSSPAAAILSPDGVDGATIRAAIRQRRLREQFFPAELFADPAWDMLLDLMAARIEGRQVAVSSLCIAAAVPPTTALRWMQSMTDAGLLVRKSDPVDRRRVFIVLSDDAAGAMAGYFRAIEKQGGTVAA